MDRFALKQTFYSTERPREKQGAGFLSDKVGLATEIAWLDFALEKNIPALLVDLSDTIRHGDVCLMGEPDPFLIEVKAGSEVDRRGRRQKRNLAKLREFFENDRAEGLRGAAGIRRVAPSTPGRDYVEELNGLIAEAMKNGHAVHSPEAGLHYIVMTSMMTSDGSEVGEILERLKLKKSWILALNEFKNERTWAPYYPFILSIADKDHLWAFIRGDVYIVVIIEQERLCQIAREKGYDATLDIDSEHGGLTIRNPADAKGIGVSSHFLARIAFEFLSPEWVVTTAIEMGLSGAPDEVALLGAPASVAP
jgi:hypothetical protein